MSPLFSILTIVVFCFLYGAVYVIYRKQQAKKKAEQPAEEPMLDDTLTALKAWLLVLQANKT